MSKAKNQIADQVAPVYSFPWRMRDGRTCVIRNMREDDAAQFVKVIPQTVKESDFLNYFPGEFNKTVEQEREFIRNHLDKPNAWTALAEVGDQIIAYAGTVAQERKRYAHHAEFGLAVIRAFWGQGLGRKLTEMAIQHGRDVGLRKLCLRVFDSNERAIRLYESAGFIEEARLREDYQRGDGTYGDMILMAYFYQQQHM